MPYHGQIDSSVETQLDTMDERERNIFVAFFKYFDAKHRRLRNSIIVLVTIVALGCSAGIFAVKNLTDNQRSDEKAAQVTQCWSSFDGRVVLRAILNGSLSNKPNKKTELKIQQLLNQDPTLRALISLSEQSNQGFEKFAFHLLPIPQCTGHNPNPVVKAVLQEAKVPVTTKQ